MKTVVFFLLIASAYQVKSDNQLQNGVSQLETLSQKIKAEAQAVEASLGPSVAKFNNLVKQGFDDGHKQVQGVYVRALDHLNTVPDKCKQGVKENLIILQSAADKTFLSCSNLTMAVQDMGNLVVFTGDMLLGLARSVQELTWFTNCFSWNPIKSLPCFFEWIGLLYQGTKGLISSLSTFNSELDSTLLNILKVIEYCQARTVDQHSAVELMTPVHQCANEPIPHHIYAY